MDIKKQPYLLNKGHFNISVIVFSHGSSTMAFAALAVIPFLSTILTLLVTKCFHPPSTYHSSVAHGPHVPTCGATSLLEQ